MKLLFPCLFALVLGSCAIDSYSLQLGYGKASASGTVHLKDTSK